MFSFFAFVENKKITYTVPCYYVDIIIFDQFLFLSFVIFAVKIHFVGKTLINDFHCDITVISLKYALSAS